MKWGILKAGLTIGHSRHVPISFPQHSCGKSFCIILISHIFSPSVVTVYSSHIKLFTFFHSILSQSKTNNILCKINYSNRELLLKVHFPFAAKLGYQLLYTNLTLSLGAGTTLKLRRYEWYSLQIMGYNLSCDFAAPSPRTSRTSGNGALLRFSLLCNVKKGAGK